ncbi:class D sortase [Salinibacillus xinjiangensis]|uniref:Class D sortase n=2 Tax=Salinibacillus xinjiangensis TaxID=1229268 RepID=A0A6G1X419_9BACI|nr:class D sortase [Salinibacillus xinjiangensis]
MAFGLGLLIYSGWNIWSANQNQKESLAEAKELVNPESNKNNNQQEKMSAENFTANDGDVIGMLHLPAIDGELPIVEGTSEDDLEQGVGHYSSTVLPGQGNQILLSGHRDTVFQKVGELQLGDELIVDLPYGSYTYEIAETEIVDADDTTVIRDYPEEVLTLSTCYPFGFIGNAPERYIIYAYPK